MTPLPASQALDAFFLEARSKVLDLAAFFDRMGRGKDPAPVDKDPRVANLRMALEILLDESGGRAERVQKIFSMEYDPSWEKPQPRF